MKKKEERLTEVIQIIATEFNSDYESLQKINRLTFGLMMPLQDNPYNQENE